MYVYRLNTVAPEIGYLGPFQPPGKTLQDGCQNILSAIGNLLETIHCKISTEQKIRNITFERDLTVWEYYVSSTITNSC